MKRAARRREIACENGEIQNLQSFITVYMIDIKSKFYNCSINDSNFNSRKKFETIMSLAKKNWSI